MTLQIARIIQMSIIGLIVHTVFFLSIYDVYFTTSVVHGMTPHTSRYAPARRLFFIALDGVRAKSVFQLINNTSAFPFTRNIIEGRGAWGVANNERSTFTTASHIAMTSGHYENMPELLLRLETNTADVDSVYNQSRHVWAWGDDRIYRTLHVDEGNNVDFGDHEPTIRMLNVTRNFLKLASKDAVLANKLRQDKICICLQLGHTDHIGHQYDQNSERFSKYMHVVEGHIREMIEMFDKFFENDGKTAYILTSDHGHGLQRQHGTDTPLERLVPFVAWGAGVRGPMHVHNEQAHTHNSPKDWKLDHLIRHDIRMIDMAPLMAALIGVSIPMNSEAILPHQYMNVSEKERADIVCTATRQLLALMERKMTLVRHHYIPAIFQYFSDLGTYDADDLQRHIQTLIEAQKYEEAVHDCDRISHRAVRGITYYTQYHRFFLRSIVVVGFLGWILYLCTFVNGAKTDRHGCCKLQKIFISLLLCAVPSIYFYAMQLPWRYSVYWSTTIFVWTLVYNRTTNLQLWNSLKSLVQRRTKTAVLCCLEWTALIEIMVYGCTSRYLLSIGFVMVGFSAIWCPNPSDTPVLRLTWMAGCAIAAVFPTFPVTSWPTADLNRNYLVLTGELVVLAAISIFLYRYGWKFNRCIDCRASTVNILQGAIVIMSTFLAVSTRYVSHYRERVIIPYSVYASCWILICISPVWSLLVPVKPGIRLFTVLMSFLPVLILLSSSWEGLYLLCLCVLLYVWYTREDLAADLTSTVVESVEKHPSDDNHNVVNNKRADGDKHITVVNGGRSDKDKHITVANGGWTYRDKHITVVNGGWAVKDKHITVVNDDWQVEDNDYHKASAVDDTRTGQLDLQCIRRVVYMIFLCWASFFGRSTVVSMIIFYRAAITFCLTSSSLSRQGLVIAALHVLVPMLLVVCTCKAVHSKREFSISHSLISACVICNLLAMNLLYQFNDDDYTYASAASIAHYMLSTFFVVVLVTLCLVAYVLMSVRITFTSLRLLMKYLYSAVLNGIGRK